MAEPLLISKTKSVRHYSLKSKPDVMKSTGVGLLRNPPVVIPEEMPRQTMCRIFKCLDVDLEDNQDFQDMRRFLMYHQKQGETRRWDDAEKGVRAKITDPGLLERWGQVMVECRRNGFINPTATLDTIYWNQVIATYGEPTNNLCTMCDRPCRIAESISTGKAKAMKQADRSWQEPRKCWENGKDVMGSDVLSRFTQRVNGVQAVREPGEEG